MTLCCIRRMTTIIVRQTKHSKRYKTEQPPVDKTVLQSNEVVQSSSKKEVTIRTLNLNLQEPVSHHRDGGKTENTDLKHERSYCENFNIRTLKLQINEPVFTDQLMVKLQNGHTFFFPKGCTETNIRSLCLHIHERRDAIFIIDRKHLKKRLKEYIIKCYLISNDLL